MAEISRLSQAYRQGLDAGGSWKIPEDAVGNLLLTVQASDTSFKTPEASFVFRIWRIDEATGTEILMGSQEFKCGPEHNPDDPEWENPWMRVSILSARGQYVYPQLDLPARLHIGCVLEHI